MSESGVDLPRLDRAVVNAFQGGFPVVERPFDPAAAALREHGVDVTTGELVERVRRLDDVGAVSRFGPLLDAEALGGATTLVAMGVPDDRFEEVAEHVNDHGEIAHNYERDHPELNMWFVVSVADPDRVDAVIDHVEAETELRTYDMPKRREFGLEATFPVDGPLRDTSVDLSHLGPDVDPDDRGTFSPAERDLLLEIQDGLPLTETPFADVAAAIDRDATWVVEAVNRFDASGVVRRTGIVPNHYALGYTENAMTVWDVPDGVVPTVGPAVADHDFVTHCYERPRHGDVWPYNVFAMVHGRSDAECERRVEQVRETMATHWDVDGDDWDALYSTRILKKSGLRLGERARANTRER